MPPPPRFGGEAVLPLHYFRQLRQRGVEAWLVVHDRCRIELQSLLPAERERMRFVPDTAFHRALSASPDYCHAGSQNLLSA